jgi:hypothetical protein
MDSACPPEPPLRFCDCGELPSPELSARGECHSGGGGGITCRSPQKSVKKNILMISPEQIFFIPYEIKGRRFIRRR